MNMTTLDIICIVLVIGVGMIGYIKGAINTLIGLAGFIASFVIARIFSAPVTNWLLNVEPVKNFVNDTITQNAINALGQYGSEALTNLQGIGGLDFLSGTTDTSVISGSTAATLPAPGGEVRLYTRMQVREDAMTLFGFASKDERTMFDRLVSVSGVGPRLALAVLSTYTVGQLYSLVMAEDD